MKKPKKPKTIAVMHSMMEAPTVVLLPEGVMRIGAGTRKLPTITDNMPVAEVCATLGIERGDLARMMGVSKQSVSAYETGVRRPSKSALIALYHNIGE